MWTEPQQKNQKDGVPWPVVKIGTETIKDLFSIGILVIDEIHLLSDSRGPVLESLIARMIRQS